MTKPMTNPTGAVKLAINLVKKLGHKISFNGKTLLLVVIIIGMKPTLLPIMNAVYQDNTTHMVKDISTHRITKSRPMMDKSVSCLTPGVEPMPCHASPAQSRLKWKYRSTSTTNHSLPRTILIQHFLNNSATNCLISGQFKHERNQRDNMIS